LPAHRGAWQLSTVVATPARCGTEGEMWAPLWLKPITERSLYGLMGAHSRRKYRRRTSAQCIAERAGQSAKREAGTFDCPSQACAGGGDEIRAALGCCRMVRSWAGVEFCAKWDYRAITTRSSRVIESCLRSQAPAMGSAGIAGRIEPSESNGSKFKTPGGYRAALVKSA